MKKFVVFILIVSTTWFFDACKNQNTPEATVEKYYNFIMNKQYRESLKLIDFGDISIDDKNFDKIVEELENAFSGNDAIIKYEILSTKKQTKNNVELVFIDTRYYTQENQKGIEQDFTLYQNEAGEWMFTFAK